MLAEPVDTESRLLRQLPALTSERYRAHLGWHPCHHPTKCMSQTICCYRPPMLEMLVQSFLLHVVWLQRHRFHQHLPMQQRGRSTAVEPHLVGSMHPRVAMPHQWEPETLQSRLEGLLPMKRRQLVLQPCMLQVVPVGIGLAMMTQCCQEHPR